MMTSHLKLPVSSYKMSQDLTISVEDLNLSSSSSPGRSYLSLDWHSKAKELFYNEKAADDFAQDNSLDAKPTQKKQVRLEECLELYTSKEKLGENDAWLVKFLS